MKKFWFLYAVSLMLLSLGWCGVSGVGLLVAIVPTLLLSQRLGQTKKEAWIFFAANFALFALWSGLATWWVWNAAPIGAILSVLFTATLCSIPLSIFHHVSKRAPKALAYTILVSAWLSGEWLYNTGELSFPWMFLGNGFSCDTWLIQWYDTTGMFGGSLWVLVANILIFEVAAHRKKLVVALIWIIIPTTISLYKYFSWQQSDEQVTVSVVQPNFDPYTQKFNMSSDERLSIFLSLIERSADDVSYILLPETAIDDQINEQTMGFNYTVQEFSSLVARRYPKAQLIAGATTVKLYDHKVSETTRSFADGYFDVFNSALAIDTTGVEVYHKKNLVVGVEKMPYPFVIDLLSGLIRDMGGTLGGYATDLEPKLFRSPQGVVTATGICYDGVYGEYMSLLTKRGARALFIISNDGWWGNTFGHRQLFSFARLRAIESRRDIARCANTGTSGFISSRGDVIEKLGYEQQGVITQKVALSSNITIYAIWGDWILRVACYVFLLSAIYYPGYRIRKRNHLVK